MPKMKYIDNDAEIDAPVRKPRKRDVMAKTLKDNAAKGDDRWAVIVDNAAEWKKASPARRKYMSKRGGNSVRYWREALGEGYDVRQQAGMVLGRYKSTERAV